MGRYLKGLEELAVVLKSIVGQEGFHRSGKTKTGLEECVGLESQGKERSDVMQGTRV